MIRQNDFNGAKVIVRVDFNVPIQNGIVQDCSRIIDALPTIKFLQHAGAKIVLISHLGKTMPRNQAQSLKNVVEDVEREYGLGVVFIDDCLHENALSVIDNLPTNHVALMENLRFYPEEEDCDPLFAKRLANLADFYINEAFSVSHRKHASIFAVPQFLPHAPGLAFQREVRTINNFFETSLSPKICIVGGIKLSTKIKLLKNLSQKTNKLAICGKISEVFSAECMVREYEEYQDAVSEITETAQQYSCEVIAPVDWVEDSVGNRRDIGYRSVELLKQHLRECKIVLWNGPLGMFETPPFDFGTASIANEIAWLTRSGQIISVVGGGDTIFAMNRLGLTKDFSHASTAGGAFLTCLEGTELPGVVALKDDYVISQRNSGCIDLS
ncbi:MAG: phosphoglycerate kinase [Holosporaceae bacterium]|nr:phosphoglycerate kinase [Holosporaceae bacterium]